MRMREMSAAAVAAALVGLTMLPGPAAARGGVEPGDSSAHTRALNRNSHHHNRAKFDNDRRHWGVNHGQRWGHGNDHFSPRGLGGHHWGW